MGSELITAEQLRRVVNRLPTARAWPRDTVQVEVPSEGSDLWQGPSHACRVLTFEKTADGESWGLRLRC